MKETPIQFLERMIQERLALDDDDSRILKFYLPIAMGKEKMHIIKAFQNGTLQPYADKNKSEEYYNETYKQTENDENLRFY